jgi:hypothetical protein
MQHPFAVPAIVLILSFLLMACASTPTTPPMVAMTATAITTPTIVTPPTVTPTFPTLPTETAIATPVAAEPIIDVFAGTLTPLIEIPFDASTLQLSPNAQWLSYITISPPSPETSPSPGPRPTILHLVNIESGSTWEVTDDCTTFECEFAWISTGQLLWRDQGRLYLADADGQNRRDLAAPEPITEIFGATSTDMVLVRGEVYLWRLYLPDGRWDKVPTPLEGPAPIENYVKQNDHLYLTEDEKIGAVAYDVVNHEYINGYGTVILQIPLAEGSAPTYIMPPTALSYLGSDGPPIVLPMPLVDSPYWLVTEALSVSEDGYVPPVHFLIDETGTLVSQAELLGLTNYRIFEVALSPDRRWLHATIAEQLPYPAPIELSSPPIYQYVAPTHNLANGQLLIWQPLGWQSIPPIAFLLEYPSQDAFLHRLALNTGETTLLARLNTPYVNGSSSLPEISTSSTLTFIIEKSLPPRLHAYRADGTLAASTTLPTPSEDEVGYYYYLTSHDDHAYFLFADQSNVNGKPSLWQWDVIP